MSRKHYIEVARIIRQRVEDESYANDGDLGLHAIEGIASDLADMFKSDNSAFDRSRFMDACGLGGAK